MEVPSKILALTSAMAYADLTLAWQKPDGTQLAEGDSDSTDIPGYSHGERTAIQRPCLKVRGVSAA